MLKLKFCLNLMSFMQLTLIYNNKKIVTYNNIISIITLKLLFFEAPYYFQTIFFIILTK